MRSLLGHGSAHRRPLGAPWAVVLSLLAASCSYSFDEGGGDWPLVGGAVEINALPAVSLPNPPLLENSFGWLAWRMTGPDGSRWLAYSGAAALGRAAIELAPLDGGWATERFEQPVIHDSWTDLPFVPFWLNRNLLFIYQPDGKVQVHRPGRATSDDPVLDPVGELAIDEATPAARARSMSITTSRDGSSAAWTSGSDGRLEVYYAGTGVPADPGRINVDSQIDPLWSDDGEWLAMWARGWVYQNARTHDYRYFEDDRSSPVRWPPLTESLRYLPSERAFAYCDVEGLMLARPEEKPRRLAERCSGLPVRFDAHSAFEYGCYSFRPPGSPPDTLCPRPLDLQPPDGELVYVEQIGLSGDFTRIVPQERLLRVPLDGSSPPVEEMVVEGVPMALSPPHAVTTDYPSFTELDPYTHAVAAALDGQPLFERGRAPSFSRDGTRLRFLDRAATVQGLGVLRSGPVGGPYEVVARNVLTYDELPDGRLIAVTNLAATGSWNRVVLIDEDRREVRRFVEGGYLYLLDDDGRDAVVLRSPSRPDSAQAVLVAIPPRRP